VRFIAKTNKKELSSNFDAYFSMYRINNEVRFRDVNKGKFLQQFKELLMDCGLFWHMLLAAGLYAVANYVYYVSIFGVHALSSSIYLNSLQQPIADILGSLPLYYFAKLRRRTAFFFIFALVSLASFSLMFVEIPEGCQGCAAGYAQTALVALVKVALVWFYAVKHIHMAELFPTGKRAFCGSLVSFIAKFGNVFIPHAILICTERGILPQVTIGFAGIAGLFITLLTKETKDSSLIRVEKTLKKEVEMKFEGSKVLGQTRGGQET
jgi:hypothetical protein